LGDIQLNENIVMTQIETKSEQNKIRCFDSLFVLLLLSRFFL